MRRITSKIVTRAIAGYPLILGILITSIAQAGVSYPDPNVGWRYTYDGTFTLGVVDPQFVGGTGPNGYGQPNDTEGLDGTWRHDQGDKWDGTAPGDKLSDPSVSSDPLGSLTGYQGTSPGGAGSFIEGETYIRVQDAGNPEEHGWVQGNFDDPTGPSQPINTNRRVYFGHDITQDFGLGDPLPSELVMSDTGITISFRARIPNSGPLDDVYTWDDLNNEPEVIDWFQDAPGGHGMWMNNNRGQINVVQYNPDGISQTNDTLVGFSLVNSTDVTAFCDTSTGSLCSDSGSGSGGLIMNNLNGDIPSNFIDSLGAGTLNIIEISDDELNDWNEFWITMEDNGGDPGNIRVSVYMNGSTTPQSVHNVTLAANGNAVYKEEHNPFLEFGFSNNDELGALDLDFLSYQLGVIEPVPEPATLLLAMLGLASACFLRRRC